MFVTSGSHLPNVLLVIIQASADIIPAVTGYGLSQWETTLHCNVVSHWLSPYPNWFLSHALLFIHLMIHTWKKSIKLIFIISFFQISITVMLPIMHWYSADKIHLKNYQANLHLFITFPDINDLPRAVQKQLFDEVLDRDVQKGKREFLALFQYRYFLKTKIGFLIIKMCYTQRGKEEWGPCFNI